MHNLINNRNYPVIPFLRKVPLGIPQITGANNDNKKIYVTVHGL